MAVKYLSGNRIWGTNAERLALTTGVGLGSAGNGTNSGATRVSDSAGSNLGTYSWEFDGSNDYVTSGLTQNLGETFSFSMWAKFDLIEAWHSFVGKGTDDNDEEFIAYLHSDGNSNAIGGECLGAKDFNSGVTPNTTDWYHIVYTVDGDAGSYKIYVALSKE